MPLTPRRIEIIKDRPVVQAEGLTPEELGAALDRFYWGLDDMRTLPKPAYLLDKWVAKGDVHLLTAHGNAGKTLVGLAWAVAISRGLPWAGCDVLDPGRVLYFTQEGFSAIPHRLEAYMLQRGINPEDGHRGIALRPQQLRLGAQHSPYGEPTLGQDWEQLRVWIEEHEPKAVFLDPWADHFNVGNENDNNDVSLWISTMRTMLGKFGDDAPAVLVLAHTSKENKQGGDNRGATALYDGVGRSYTLSPVFEELERTAKFTTTGNLMGVKLSTEKSKDGGRPGPWHARVYEHEIEGALGGQSVALDGVSPEEFYQLAVEAKTGRRQSDQSKSESNMRAVILDAVQRNPGVLRSKITNGAEFVSGNAQKKTNMLNTLIEEGILEDDGGLYVVGQEEPEGL